MIARITKSRDIGFSLSYGQNPDKGGEIFYLNETAEYATPEEQAADWLAMANPYKTMCYNIVISMSKEDTKKIRNNIDNPKDRIEFERSVIDSFLRELNRRGNNVFDCPFVVAHHGNTDCDHFHITILTTTIDGRRFNDRFLKKNAYRGAAKISEEFGLEAAPRAFYWEKKHQEAQGRRKSESEGKTRHEARRERDENRRKRGYTRMEKDPNDMQERRRRYEMAEKRKKQCRYEIEVVAKDKTTTGSNYLKRLSDKGIGLYFDPYEMCIYAEIHDADDDRQRTYSLDKELGVDMQLLERLGLNAPVKERVDKVGTKKYQVLKAKVEKENAAKSKSAKVSSASHSTGNHNQGQGKSAQSALRSGSQGLDGHLNVGAGSHGGRTQQGNVNPDGSRSSCSDDMDEEWRRRNGYHY